jgi:hypothetical protein
MWSRGECPTKESFVCQFTCDWAIWLPVLHQQLCKTAIELSIELSNELSNIEQNRGRPTAIVLWVDPSSPRDK